MTLRVQQVGVTLIELLIVLVIVGLLASLVSPVMYRQIEKGQAETEFMTLRSQLRTISATAFARGRPAELQLQDRRLSWVVEGLSSRAIEFKYLEFPSQKIIVSKNGLADRESLSVKMPQATRDVPLNAFLSVE
jgi:type II secretion system protein H